MFLARCWHCWQGWIFWVAIWQEIYQNNNYENYTNFLTLIRNTLEYFPIKSDLSSHAILQYQKKLLLGQNLLIGLLLSLLCHSICLHSYTGCSAGPETNYLLIAQARKQPISWDMCHFFDKIRTFSYLVSKENHNSSGIIHLWRLRRCIIEEIWKIH